MARGEMLPIQHAARALGVPDDQLRRLAKHGSIPGAVNRNGEWLVPTMSLVTIAKQQGWTLDLAALQQQLDEHSLSRYTGDALAAQAAVLLAKTQATAARVESRDLLRRLREATNTAVADRAARLESAASLAALEQELEEARRNHAVAEAQLAELRIRLAVDDQQFDFMVDRIKALERERRRLDQSLGWFGRIRYRRLVERDLSTPSPEGEPRPDPGPPKVELPMPSDQPGAGNHDDQPFVADGTSSAPETADALPAASTYLPPVPISGASTIIDAHTTVDIPQTEVDPDVGADHDDNRLGSTPGDRREQRVQSVTRTPDGRFDRSPVRVQTEASVPTR